MLFNYEYFANLRIFRKQAIASRLIIVNVKILQEYFNCIVIRKLFKHKKRPDEHYFFLYSHSLITFMQKIDYQGFFYIK